MMRSLFELEPSLIGQRRWPWARPATARIAGREVAALVGLGLLAAAITTWWDFNLRIPGHAILRAILPITLGMAAVPRRGAGATVGVVGAGTCFSIQWLNFGSAGEGALTSLMLAGVLLDVAASIARRGWQLYVGLMSAGLITNLIAFAVKAAAKYSGGGGGKPWDVWLPQAAVSYPTFGILAGLICAVTLFRLRGSTKADA